MVCKNQPHLCDPILGSKSGINPVTGSPAYKHGGARPGSGKKKGTNKNIIKRRNVKKMGATRVINYRRRAQAAKIRDEVTLVLVLY